MIRVLDSANVYRLEVTDEYGDSAEYTLYERRNWKRADGTQVEIFVDGDVADERIRRALP